MVESAFAWIVGALIVVAVLTVVVHRVRRHSGHVLSDEDTVPPEERRRAG